MLKWDAFAIRGIFSKFIVRVQPLARATSEGESELALLAFRSLRFKVEGNDPDAIETAQRIAQSLSGEGSFKLRRLSPSLIDHNFMLATLRELESAFRDGRLSVERVAVQQFAVQPPLEVPDLPPRPRPRAESALHSFELRLVDEIGRPIGGVDAEFSADAVHTVAVNAGGAALLEGMQTSSATASLKDAREALSKVLEPRWEKFRPGQSPTGGNVQQVVFGVDKLGSIPLKAEVPNTLVLTPPLGKLFVELFDKTGRVRHANRTFQITGPQSFEGTTDGNGVLLQEDVFPGDYSLSLALEFFEAGDPDRAVDIVDSALVVRDSTAGDPEVRMLGAVPRSVLARMQLFFNTNKTFLLPTALPSVLELRNLYVDNAPCQVLVVGHADTKGTTAYNDKLSLERAQSIIAYLKDDIDAWLAFYGAGVEAIKRWGKVEDHLMITAMPGFASKHLGDKPVEWFQRTRGLKVDGVAGDKTRRALIKEYMGLDGASLSDFVGKIEATAHGCGENFPLDESGAELDAAPEDEKRDRIDRRAELFFFDTEFGITPPPPGQNSKPGSAEYPLWRKRVVETVELSAAPTDRPKVVFVELADAHFRTNSAVVLPDGEAPDEKGKKGERGAPTSAGLIATALRFNEEHPGRTLLVAGHTDTTASIPFNQKLSEERATVALALLKGGDSSREAFKSVSNGRHTVADIKQILAWVSQDIPGFACDPGAIDDNSGTLPGPVKKFQIDFNIARSTIAPSTAALSTDGVVGPLTWGAFFDCYEFALLQELGETPAGLAALRAQLSFADPDHPSLGFSEHFPIEELGVDHFRSQTNRRIEIVFFDPNELPPDIAHAAEDPETSDLYLPGFFERAPIPTRESGLSRTLTLDLELAPDLPWTTSDTIVIRDSTGSDVLRTTIGTGEAVGSARRFSIVRDPSERFQAEVIHARGSAIVFNQLTAPADTFAL